MQMLDKRRHREQAKDADRLAPKGTVVGTGFPNYPVMGKTHHRRIEQTFPVLLYTSNTVSP